MKNSTCSRSSATVSRSREFSAVCQPPVISLRMRSQICARLGGRARQPEAAEQQLRDLLLLAQDRAARRFGRMRGEHRLDPHLEHQAADLVERRAPAPCSRVDGLDDAARLRRAFVQILAAAADAMHLLRHVDHFEPSRERAHQVARLRGRHVARAGRELAGALGARRRAARSPPDGRCSTASNKRIAALLADHLADQRAEHVHVFAQLGVFERKGNVGARHGRGARVRASLAERLLRWSK